MQKNNWLLYGAYGYSGQLIAEHAVACGHRPVLAGRSEKKLRAISERLNLEYRVVSLNEPAELANVVRDFKLVLHAAGPFQQTAHPMVNACLQTQTHYLDITGEVPVFEKHLALDNLAKIANCAVISGVGFDVVPSDCILNLVAREVPNADQLEMAFAVLGGGASAGTTNSMIEMLPHSAMIRRNGNLLPIPLGSGARSVRFLNRESLTLPICWGDLSTAYRSTGIPNITTYMALPKPLIRLLQIAGVAGQFLLSPKFIRQSLKRLTPFFMHGPNARARTNTLSHIWAKASGPEGIAQAWLVTPEAYQFTAISSVASVEYVLAGQLRGAFTPAQAFGAEFVLNLPGVKLYRELPESGQADFH